MPNRTTMSGSSHLATLLKTLAYLAERGVCPAHRLVPQLADIVQDAKAGYLSRGNNLHELNRDIRDHLAAGQ